jgi:hypothetical protein
MRIYDNSPEAAIIRRSAPTPENHQPDPGAEPRPLTLTCLEAPAEFEKLRAGVYQEFAPANFFRRCLADEVAEELWMKRRISDIANQSLSLQIELDYDKVSAAYPNADPALRTVLAWKEFHKEAACRSALSERTRGTRSLLNLARHLSSSNHRK